MKYAKIRTLGKWAVCAQLLLLTPCAVWPAALTLPDKPIFAASPVPPIAMLTVTKDQQLYYKAYNDFSDLDGDGALETTYKHGFDYYGYFDSYKCYDYDTTNKRFTPAAVTTDKYCSGKWSGNFLNWVSMSRMDILRKVLYGGTRYIDNGGSSSPANLTVLERVYLPTEAHSWAKYYNGSDIDKLTPFSGIATSPPTGTSGTTLTIPTSSTSFPATRTFSSAMTGIQIGDQILAQDSGASTTNFMYGVVTATASGSFTIKVDSDGWAGSGSHSSWTITNLSATGISFCNTTWADTSQKSQTTTNPPLIRAARGNFALWSANERWQCYWSEERSNAQSGFSGGIRSNGNRYQRSGLPSSAENPSYSGRGLFVSGLSGKADYVARVEVCNTSLLGKEKCKQYPNGNYKPVGLLQDYGEPVSTGSDPRIRFGLITGSYRKNISGGVVRKNVGLPTDTNKGSLADEINVASDGTFVSSVTYGVVKTLDKLRLYGYDYNDGTYIGQDNCTYQQIGIVTSGGAVSGGSPANEGNCSNWGNPIAEMYLESLRYLAGKSPNSAFTYSSSAKDSALGLPLPPSWTDPVTADTYCAPMNVLVVNASEITYDADQLGGFVDIVPGGSTPVPAGCTSAATCTDKVGEKEGLSTTSPYTNTLVGDDGVTSADLACTAKAVGKLSDARGICPEAPSQKGSYLIGGVAYYAHMNRIRSSPPIPDPTTDKTSYKVNTYSVQLATSVPRINVQVAGKTVTIQPAYRLDLGSGKIGTGTIVDFKVVQQDASSGTFYVNWEDSNQGGDYDQDVLGIIRYTVSGSTIAVTTQVISASTANGQGFGYTISGTTKDGPHFYSGIYGFSYSDPTNITVTPSTNINATGGCSGCNDNSSSVARTAVYTVGTTTALSLQDPLYYAAKWGGFKDGNANSTADVASEWDSAKVDGTTGSDGQPDNYFFVNNPGALEQSLSTAFKKIAELSAASAVATDSTSLKIGTKTFQARFSPGNWTGELVAYEVDPVTLTLTKLWNAADNLATPDFTNRVIYTYNSALATKGTTFVWANLSAAQQTALQGTDTAAVGQNRVDYLRGSAANEGIATTDFRPRPYTVSTTGIVASKLGDIISSNPFFVGPPSGQYDAKFRFFGAYSNTAYTSFRSANKSRPAMVYVGGNDGMLHGFDAADGTEKVAYIPSAVYPNLIELTRQSYDHKFFVDGSPTVADAEVSGSWMTVLVGGLNQGGRGIYALDVTDPSSFANTTGAAGAKVLWEFNSTDDVDLGYTFGRPMIVKMNNGKWAVILGNGYNSASGRGKLFILFIEDGKDGTWSIGDFVKIDTGAAYTDATAPNGLSEVNAIDVDGNGTVDFIYAGDLQGNLWKFDVSNADKTVWDVATISGSITARQPLFIACTDATDPCPTAKRQPITARPELGFHPQNLDTMLVYFGTGKYMESGDNSDTKSQSFYAIWDKGLQVKRNTTDLKQLVITTAADKVSRTIAPTTGDPDGISINWTTKKGWFQDLPGPDNAPGSGERVVSAPSFLNGLVSYNTFITSSSPCDFGSTGYLMRVLYETGMQSVVPIFDTNGDGVVNAADAVVGGINVGGALGGSTIIGAGTPTGTGIAITSSTKLTGTGEPSVIATDTGSSQDFRISWRELVPE